MKEFSIYSPQVGRCTFRQAESAVEAVTSVFKRPENDDLMGLECEGAKYVRSSLIRRKTVREWIGEDKILLVCE